MTKEEIYNIDISNMSGALKAMQETKKSIEELYLLKSQLEDHLKSFSEFKKGDKVIVTTHNKKIICFINEVEVNWDYNIKYSFSKMKKDGSIGNVGAGVYSYISIEKFEK